MQPEIWIDANLPPSLAKWITQSLGHRAFSVFYLEALTSTDLTLFNAALARKDVIILTKDQDFASLVDKFGPPPRIIWVTIGNCSNEKLKHLIVSKLQDAINLLSESSLVELTN